ncbi:MAG: hypothetical protein ACE5QW_09270 [Thermoplasmata archaeon]
MPPRRGKEPEKCEISDCNDEAVRSIPAGKLKGALSDVSFEKERGRVHICKSHYKKYKKATKENRKLERLGW